MVYNTQLQKRRYNPPRPPAPLRPPTHSLNSTMRMTSRIINTPISPVLPVFFALRPNSSKRPPALRKPFSVRSSASSVSSSSEECSSSSDEMWSERSCCRDMAEEREVRVSS
mgnify:FL=1